MTYTLLTLAVLLGSLLGALVDALMGSFAIPTLLVLTTILVVMYRRNQRKS